MSFSDPLNTYRPTQPILMFGSCFPQGRTMLQNIYNLLNIVRTFNFFDVGTSSKIV